MRGPRACQLDRVFHRFRQLAGIGGLDDIRPGRSQALKEHRGRARRIKQHPLAGKLVKGCVEITGQLTGDAVVQVFQEALAQFFGRHEPAHPPVVMEQGKGQRKRRAGDIAAPDIEQPGNGIGKA